VTTFVVGGNGASTTFNGRIIDGNSPTRIVKVGNGAWTLTSVNNTYSGGTTVSNGTLLVNGPGGNGAGTGAVVVASSATLGGNGTIGGPVTVNSGGTFTPGGDDVGTLTISNNLILNGVVALQYDLGTNSDQTIVSSNLTLGGTLNVSDAGGFGGGTYTLFTYGGSLTYNGVTIGTVPNTNHVYTILTNVPGQVQLQVIAAPVAVFTADPTRGLAPLTVTFTDASTGTITNRHWDFGDGNTLDTTATSAVHTYATGAYTVTLTESGPRGVSSITESNLIAAVTPFQAWQLLYFGSTDATGAAGDADPDGDGMSNLAEFLAGTDPTNSLSGLKIISLAQQGNDLVITWTTAGGRTNQVQATAGDANGGFMTNFVDVSGPIIIPSAGDMTTNYVETGGATNAPARYYRVRLVP
jgi:fibronectin-binding autotransporter adhesin